MQSKWPDPAPLTTRRRATVAALVGLTAAAYFLFGALLIPSAVYDRDGLLFQTDTAEAAEDITSFRTPAHGDTTKHPLYVLLVNPWGVLLAGVLPTPWAITVLNAALGALSVLAAFACFRRTGMDFAAAWLWAAIAAFSTAHLLFGALPERHSLAVLSMTVLTLAAVGWPGRLARLVPAGVFALGVTVTNAAHAAVLFLASLFAPDRPDGPRRWVARTALFVVLTAAVAAALSGVQHLIWPEARSFLHFSAVYENESAHMPVALTAEVLKARAAAILAHMFCFNLAAPRPALAFTGELPSLTFLPESFAEYSWIGWTALALWAAMLAWAVAAGARTRRWRWLQAGVGASLLGHFALHLIYGDDMLLYAVNWTFPLLAAVAASACAVPHGRRLAACRLAMLAGLTVCLAINNAVFAATVVRYFCCEGNELWERRHPEARREALAVAEFLAEHGVRQLYGNTGHYWLESAGGGDVRVVDLARDRSPRAKIESEQAVGPCAYADDIGGISGFVRQTGGRLVERRTGRHTIQVAYPPGKTAVRGIEPDEMAWIGDEAAAVSNAAAVSDERLCTRWIVSGGDERCLEFRFHRLTPVCGARMVAADGEYPRTWRIEIRSGDGQWRAATPLMNRTGFFWSGPRPFWQGPQHRQEARFEPMLAEAVRLLVAAGEGTGGVARIARVQWLAPAEGEAVRTEPEALPDVLAWLDSSGCDRLYCGRWMANRVRVATAGRVETPLPEHIYGQRRSRPILTPDVRPTAIYLTHRTALLVPAKNAGPTRRALALRGKELRETAMPPWVVFDIAPEQWRETWHGYSGLAWANDMAQVAGPDAHAKRAAMGWVREARAVGTPAGAADADRREALTLRALELYPDCQEALIEWAAIRSERGDVAGATEARARLDGLRRAAVPAEVSFGGGLRLLGCEADTTRLDPGGTLCMRFFWRLAPGARPGRWAAFVHILRDRQIVFQCDFNLFTRYQSGELACRGPDEVFVDETIADVPERLSAGEYEIFMGVYDPHTGKRLTPRTALRVRRKGVWMPLVLTH